MKFSELPIGSEFTTWKVFEEGEIPTVTPSRFNLYIKIDDNHFICAKETMEYLQGEGHGHSLGTYEMSENNNIHPFIRTTQFDMIEKEID